jgi:hypothetical protein
VPSQLGNTQQFDVEGVNLVKEKDLGAALLEHAPWVI